MNWHFSFEPNTQTFIIRADGMITSEEIKHGTLKVIRDRRFTSDARFLMDFEKAADWKVSADELAEDAELTAFDANSRRAVVIGHGLGTGIFLFWQAHTKPGTARIFNDHSVAIEWLADGSPTGIHLM